MTPQTAVVRQRLNTEHQNLEKLADLGTVFAAEHTEMNLFGMGERQYSLATGMPRVQYEHAPQSGCRASTAVA